ncbi:helix-turn-helix domain-containing protein [Yersinia enterocolitica]|uniref:helix-turn-helix domain-containing protein n=1 Tax=Yersinia TaxID=629 RepID=UPI001643A923|nr:XRE family transcriptional regulator [Yersinia alsatica]EKN3571899.1 ImmA/IrrE family metallo-endopeptidase [Yersinia enterocolitica]EKN4744965.1 ImmA/IrrE family metallo-endopeptidase [Yersinia enterocolitica]EKN4841100.1 ImmA/IrrE family metallo-endopeptidase [Yersinia enterocolitica]EKN4875834.1 ImmA/IrrE family metallo-endopeptidase [Yersinia enterocolitica]HDL6530218.1 ImmA/IrrE family metallo-endopeptidase [Yersinia enterocolitica]
MNTNDKESRRLFNPSRLKLARIRRKLTLKELAEATGLSSRIVIEYEKEYCLYEPTPATVIAYSKALNYPESFFFGDDLENIDPSTVSFRSLRRTKAADQHAAIGAGGLGVIVANYFDARFNLPVSSLPDMRGTTPEAAAEALREEWHLGKKSVPNMVHLLEKNGVKVFFLSENTADIDAFSFWKDSIPYIFLNTKKTGERSRFDAAHELGHLVMHRHGVLQGADIEKEADAFASAFLMPKENVLAVKMVVPTLDKIIQLKSNWLVSAIALIVRMRNLGGLSEWQYNSLMRDASTKGYRYGEPGGIERERSLIIDRVLSMLQAEGVTLPVIAKKLNIPLDELSSLLFGVAAVGGGGHSSPAAKPALKLV